jgi:hypothetical protein
VARVPRADNYPGPASNEKYDARSGDALRVA